MPGPGTIPPPAPPPVTPGVVTPPPVAPAGPDAPAALASDPAQWGRVDDEGNVWVRTGEGERSVGSYPGATSDEALAYFGRKYDELAGQVLLLEQRVQAAGLAPKDALTSVEHLREAVTGANAVGDLAALERRVDALTVTVQAKRAEADAHRARAREKAKAAKERLVAEAESLVDSKEWKPTGDRLRALLDEWKVAPRLDRKTDDALWKRFSHARTAFDKHRRAHFAELDISRAAATEAKEKLIREAESLSDSKDWGATATRYRELMRQWKAAGRARRDVEDELWTRFRAAQDVFFAARGEVFAARDADLQANLERKRALLTQAERLVPVTDPRSARAAMRGIHEQWEAAGHVPRNARDDIEERLRKVDDTIRAAEESQWKRSNPEAVARAEATVAQLRTSIASLEKEAATARDAGRTDAVEKAEAAAQARREWLAEAEKTLAEFS